MFRISVLTLLLVGCSNDHRSAPQAKPVEAGPSVVSKVIGPEGGVVELPGGPRLEIPAGSLVAPRTFSITRLGEQYPVGALSSAYAFSPRDLAFAHPATVSFPVPDGLHDVDIYWLVNGGTRHDRLGAALANHRLTGEVIRLGTAYLAPRAGGRAVWGRGAKPGRIVARRGRTVPCDVRVFADGTYLVPDVREGDDVVLLETVSDVAGAPVPAC